MASPSPPRAPRRLSQSNPRRIRNRYLYDIEQVEEENPYYERPPRLRLGEDFEEEEIQEDAESRARKMAEIREKMRKGAELALESEEEESPSKCKDVINMSNENIAEYLRENKGNFIIQMPDNNNFECQSIDALKNMYSRVDELDGTNYYELFYVCKNDNPLLQFTENDYIRENPYIKLGSPNFLVEKPDWLYEGTPPEPRIFKIVEKKDETGKVKKAVFVSETGIKVGSKQWNDLGLGSMVSEWHCNAGEMRTYRLEPISDERAIEILQSADAILQSAKRKRGGTKKYGGRHKKNRNKKTKKIRKYIIKKISNKKHIRKISKKINKIKLNKIKRTRRNKL